jgi:hypothetical protein
VVATFWAFAALAEGSGSDTATAAAVAEAVNRSIAVDSFKVLLQIFLLAVVLEQALSVIFNWRVFLDNFNSSGMRTVITVLVAYWTASLVEPDLVARLLATYKLDKLADPFMTTLLTALTLAGGSSGVNKLLIALGFRVMRTQDEITRKPPPTEAWVAVRLIRVAAVGQVTVSFGPDSADLPVVGVIDGTSPRNKLLRYVFVDRGRFPRVAGFSLVPQPGIRYLLRLDGRDSTGQPISSLWGPHPIAPGAVVDVDVSL